MDVRTKQIRNLLWLEVASKSLSAALAFSIFAIVIFFYHFNLTAYRIPVQIACVGVVLANIFRIWISKKIMALKNVDQWNLNVLRTSIWLNTLAWSCIFSFGTLELNLMSHDFAFLITIMSGFLAASIVTLAYDKTIFFPFQLIILIPLISISFYQKITGANDVGHYFSFFLIIFLIYQFKQYRDYRTQLMQRFNYQLDLEESFKELKKSQTALIEQTSQLIHASKISALGEMAGGLAHEINNSLMVILGSTQQAQRELSKSERLTPEIENKFRQSTTSIMKIKSVIEGLKQFSLQMEPQPKEDIPLQEIIDRTLTYTSELLKAHGTTFTVEEVPEIKLHCHPFQITQILFNLIKNADDAINNSPAGGHWVKIKFESEGGFTMIKVINGGSVVSSENVQKLFQPFFTTKEVGQGTGLSLSISKGIARDHKGDLYFERNNFTTFILKLPITKTRAL